MKILVTGGCGFIGSNFIRQVLSVRSDSMVVNVDKMTYAGNAETTADFALHRNYTFFQRDISDFDSMCGIMRKYEIDSVVNFAAESHVDRSIGGPLVFEKTNVGGTLSLLEAARKSGVKKFCQVSTDEVYGSLGETGEFTEKSPIDPRSPYSASKAAADQFVMSYFHTYGMDVSITRCSNNYGPFQFPEKMIPLMILKAMNNKALPVYGDGLNVRDWIHVDDHCRAIWEVLTRGEGGQAYNIGGASERTNLQVVRDILRLTGKTESLISYVEDRKGHDRRYAMDFTKMKNELGWVPTVKFEDGLADTVKWYMDKAEWCRAVETKM
jgi:dTDP-glucose 4,6-dehydratase